MKSLLNALKTLAIARVPLNYKRSGRLTKGGCQTWTGKKGGGVDCFWPNPNKPFMAR